MTIEEFIKAAGQVKNLAAQYLKGYERYYDLKYLDGGNIEFEVYPYKEKEFLESLPDDAEDIRIYLQFCFCHNEWLLCAATTIRDVGEYKKWRARKNGK